MYKKLIDKKELLEKVPYSAQHILRLEKLGQFPPRRKIGENRVAWLEEEVDRWIDNCETLKHPVEYKLPEIFIPHLERIISCNRKFNGMPYVKDAYIPVLSVIELFLKGKNVLQIIEIHSSLTKVDVAACLSYFCELTRDELAFTT